MQIHLSSIFIGNSSKNTVVAVKWLPRYFNVKLLYQIFKS